MNLEIEINGAETSVEGVKFSLELLALSGKLPDGRPIGNWKAQGVDIERIFPVSRGYYTEATTPEEGTLLQNGGGEGLAILRNLFFKDNPSVGDSSTGFGVPSPGETAEFIWRITRIT
ncbi:MAG: hypothetical protein R8G34_23450 [Paracoccaceae bacterium]|nr:hypothetical protein [Paracoccaceae bacterium]